MTAPPELTGMPLGESGLRAEYKVTVVCVKKAGSQFTYADRETVLSASDLIVVAGHREDVGRFAGSDR
jgi:trk system potassium uptake protein TrkA